MRLQKPKMQPQEFRIQESVARKIKELWLAVRAKNTPAGLCAQATT